MTSLRVYVPAGVLLAGCLLIWNVRSQQAIALQAPLATLVPADANGFTVTNREISAEERRVAGMTDYVMRVYSRKDTLAYTEYVGYYDYQTQGKTVHSPRNCLPGAGWEVLQPGTREVETPTGRQRVNRYVMSNGRASALVYYWYQGRGRVASNEYLVKWYLLRDAALYGRTDEALVRVIVPLPSLNKRAGISPASLAASDSVASAVSARLLRQVDRALRGAPSLAETPARETRG